MSASGGILETRAMGDHHWNQGFCGNGAVRQQSSNIGIDYHRCLSMQQVAVMSESADQIAERLAKRVAVQAGCSRAEAERYIQGGWVQVDGQLVDRPEARVRPSQTVVLDPAASAAPLPPTTIVWFKPEAVALPDGLHLPSAVAESWFDAGHRTPSDRPGGALPRAQLHRLQPLMPLTLDATGLMVFSQHTAVSRRLIEGFADLEQEWLVDLLAPSAPRSAEECERCLVALRRPGAGLLPRLAPLRVSWQSDHRLRLAVKGWTASQLMQHIQSASLPVASARRQRIGRVGLAGLTTGQWRQLGIGERF